MTWAILSLLLAVEAVFIIAARNNPARLRLIVVVNILLVGSFGSLLADFSPLGISNYGNAWYSGAIASQILIYELCNREEAVKTQSASYFGFAFFLFAVIPLEAATVQPWDENGAAVMKVITRSPQIFVGSYMALWASLGVMALIYNYIHAWKYQTVAMVALCVATQTVDSIVFFSVAFYGSSIEFIAHAIVTGTLIKAPATLVILAAGMLAARWWPVATPIVKLIRRKKIEPKHRQKLRRNP